MLVIADSAPSRTVLTVRTALSAPSNPLLFTTRGRLASTGLMKELQRAQVQVPGKTVWNDSTANY